MFLKSFSLFFSLCIYSFFLGQNTNVLLPKRKIKPENLTNLYFQNGEKINIVYQSNENYRELWSKLSNQSIVFITNNNEYLYNYKAVNDSRNICDDNYQVLTSKDLVNVKGQFTNSPQSGGSNFDLKNDLIFTNTKILNNNSDCDSLNKFDLEKSNESFIAIKGDLKPNSDNQKFIPVVGFYKGVKNNLLFSFLNYSQGFPIRCIEKINYIEYYQNKEFNYNELIPDGFDSLKNVISNRIKSFRTISENETFYFSSELIFDSNGKNLSKLISVKTKQNHYLQEELFKTISNWTLYPYYEDIKIKSKASIDIKLIRYLDRKSDFSILTNQKVYDLRIDNLNNKLFNLVRSCADKEFKFNYRTVNYRVEINGYLENEPLFNVLNKVKGKGPIYSLLSVVPGLGQLKIKQQDRKLRLWHFSVPVGAIAIASKIYSNYCYSKYLNNLDGTGSRKYYTNANFSQRVFMSSLIAYSAMSLVDFTLTFGIGCKNKITQMKVNSLIRDLK